MIDTKLIATLGVYPGSNTFNIATLGYNFRIYVELHGNRYIENIENNERLITVIVEYNKHVYKSSILIDNDVLKNLMFVYVKFNNIIQKIINIKTSVKSIIKKITVKKV